MKGNVIWALALVVLMLEGCSSGNMGERQRLERSVVKELPFHVDSVTWLTGGDIPAFRFSNAGYTAVVPDAEIRPDGDYWVCSTFDTAPPMRQSEDNIWRNVVVSRKNQRVVCIDRYLRQGRTVGYCYVLQSERKEYPTCGTFHWDVSDPRNIEMVGVMLDDMREIAMNRHHYLDDAGRLAPPMSQDDYWNLIFHGDSLLDAGLHDEARQAYDLAFSDDRYILPSQLSTTAMKMSAIGDNQAAVAYLLRRIAMEKDYYEDPSLNPYVELNDTFEVRSRAYHYDLALKQQLEGILERDQHDRLLWSHAIKSHPDETERNELLARRALLSDSVNLALVSEILSQYGFPRKEVVGEMANQAVWLVFQHAALDYQQRFLPQLEEAVGRGDIAPMFLALLRDRIDVREGRPQRYGTQIDDKGRLAPLLDATQVNRWRQEVGLPPIEGY